MVKARKPPPLNYNSGKSVVVPDLPDTILIGMTSHTSLTGPGLVWNGILTVAMSYM